MQEECAVEAGLNRVDPVAELCYLCTRMKTSSGSRLNALPATIVAAALLLSGD